jgi:integrase
MLQISFALISGKHFWLTLRGAKYNTGNFFILYRKVIYAKYRIITPAELKGFLSSTTEDRWNPAFVIAANSGLRLEKGLRWPNVDLDKGVIKVREAVSPVKDGDGCILETHDPKSKKGKRDVPIPEVAVKAFKQIETRQKKG